MITREEISRVLHDAESKNVPKWAKENLSEEALLHLFRLANGLSRDANFNPPAFALSFFQIGYDIGKAQANGQGQKEN